MNETKTEEQSELLYSSVFKQIQESGDIISSILFISKFITENDISVEFNIDKLRTIALRATDIETSTYLWHINALIAASCDFEHLLLGIEIMFDRFLGNKDLFMKEKEKQKEKTISTPVQSKSSKSNRKYKNNKYIGNEIVSFVNTCYDKYQDNNQEIKEQEHEDEINDKLQNTNIENKNTQNTPKILFKLQNASNSPKTQYINDENKEYMNKYRGKISSPMSFRMRQQKRSIQNERRNTSRNSRRNTSVDFDYINYTKKTNKINNNYDDMDDVSINISSAFEPEILSPFNVSKFAKIVDFKQ